jgi:adhesin/invasin
VEVLDAQKNPVPNTTVTFTATNATLNPATATTEATGRAVTRVTLGTAGSASVSAAVAGLAPVTFVFTVTASATVPTISAVVNGASFLRPLAPGSWMTLGGQNLAKAVATANAVPFPTTLGGVRVRVNNTFVPLLYVSSIQVNVQLPYEIPAGQATAVIEVDGTSSASFPFQVTATGPGIFVFGNNRAVVQNVDASGAVTLNTSDDPVKAGGIIIAYLTGQGPLDNPLATNALAPSSPLSRATSTYSATIGTRPAAVAFLGMTPGFVALAQANITVPDDLPTGDYPLVISVGGVDSNGPLISVVAK